MDAEPTRQPRFPNKVDFQDSVPARDPLLQASRAVIASLHPSGQEHLEVHPDAFTHTVSSGSARLLRRAARVSMWK